MQDPSVLKDKFEIFKIWKSKMADDRRLENRQYRHDISVKYRPILT